MKHNVNIEPEGDKLNIVFLIGTTVVSAVEVEKLTAKWVAKISLWLKKS